MNAAMCACVCGIGHRTYLRVTYQVPACHYVSVFSSYERLIFCSFLHYVQKKRDQNVFVISRIKLGRFWWNLVQLFL